MSVVASKILLASVSFIEPTAGASYIEAVATPTYIEAVIKPSYIQAVVTAEVTMPDVLAVEVVTPTDLVTLATIKSLLDTATPADILAQSFAKSLADSQGMSDSLVRDISKALSDTQAIAEAKAISFGKALADTTTPADLASLTPIKNLADSIGTPTDALANVVYKALADSQTLSDVIVATLVFIRDFTDSVTVPDTPAISFTPATITDAITGADSKSLTPDKGLADGLFMTDNMDGDIEYSIVKTISEILLSSDASTVAFAANKDDNLATSSSGVLTMQDYCDITYFLEDYVGTSRTFT